MAASACRTVLTTKCLRRHCAFLTYGKGAIITLRQPCHSFEQAFAKNGTGVSAKQGANACLRPCWSPKELERPQGDHEGLQNPFTPIFHGHSCVSRSFSLLLHNYPSLSRFIHYTSPSAAHCQHPPNIYKPRPYTVPQPKLPK